MESETLWYYLYSNNLKSQGFLINTYDTQFTTITGERKKDFMHDMHKLAVDVTFTQLVTKKGIKKHGERAASAMYKEYTQLEDMKVMGALNSDNLTRPQNKGALRAINLIKENGSEN